MSSLMFTSSWLCAAPSASNSNLLTQLLNCTCDAKVRVYNAEILEWKERRLSGEYHQLFRALLKN